MQSRGGIRARQTAVALAAAIGIAAAGLPDAGAETLHIGARNCYDAFDTWISGSNVVTPGSWVVQDLRVHVNANIRNRCDPNSYVIDGTYTTGAVWEGGSRKGTGGPWWTHKYQGWYTLQIGYWAPTGVGVHEMRAYILSSLSTYPSPSFYNAAARTWLEVVSPPGTPRNVRTAPVEPDKVSVHWDAPASDGGRAIQGYEIWRDGRPYRNVGSGERSVVDGPFPPGECHSYFVKAYNSVGHSGGSNSATGCAPPDRTAPTVTGIFSREPDSNGWYNAPASIDWTATDPYPSSGAPSDPPDTPVDRRGTHEYVSEPSCDPVRNCASGLRTASFDPDPPILTADAGTESAPGWHNADTTVTWSCTDDLSGVATCPAAQHVVDEGRHVVTGSATDIAANEGTASVTVNIDRTAPVTTTDAPADWQAGDVSVSLATTDNLSGVATTTSRLDGGSPVDGTVVAVAGDGEHVVEYWATDLAGNAEPAGTATVRIDSVQPTVTATAEPAANPAGWNDESVTVTWNCSDDRSGVASCSPPVTISDEGVHTVSGTAVDAAGNATAMTYVVRVDRTGPSLEAQPNRAPDGNGAWYLGPVDVSWSCSDVLSGTASCPAPTRLDQEGDAITVTATATDNAGNSTTVTSQPFAIDLAGATATVDPPRVNGVGFPIARAVTGTARDTMSGVARVEVEFTPSNGGAPLPVVRATCSSCGGGTGSRNVTWQVEPSALPRGSYVVRARAYDAAGHAATWSPGVSMVVVP